MNELDLHGVTHGEAERLVENFLILDGPPARIITGNSPRMKDIVFRLSAKHGFHVEHESDWNLGSLLITERH